MKYIAAAAGAFILDAVIYTGYPETSIYTYVICGAVAGGIVALLTSHWRK